MHEGEGPAPRPGSQALNLAFWVSVRVPCDAGHRADARGLSQEPPTPPVSSSAPEMRKEQRVHALLSHLRPRGLPFLPGHSHQRQPCMPSQGRPPYPRRPLSAPPPTLHLQQLPSEALAGIRRPRNHPDNAPLACRNRPPASDGVTSAGGGEVVWPRCAGALGGSAVNSAPRIQRGR